MIFEVGEVYFDTPYLFADIVELLLITNNFGRSQVHENDLSSLLRVGLPSIDELDDILTFESDPTLSTAQRKDVLREKLEDVFSHLEYRQKEFGNFYPYTVSDKQLSRKEHLTAIQQLYIFLLTCSRLRSFPVSGGIRQKWAGYFTKLSKAALQGLLASHSGTSIRIFDSHSEDRENYYGHQAAKALEKLGQDMAVNLVIRRNLPNNPRDTGDSGIDLVAIVDFQDGATSNYVILGQCAAQEKNWPQKRLDNHPSALRHLFHQLVSPFNVVFIPVCYRQSSGEWFEIKHANDILLLDRLRILNLINWQDKAECLIGSDWFIDFNKQIQEARLDWE